MILPTLEPIPKPTSVNELFELRRFWDRFVAKTRSFMKALPLWTILLTVVSWLSVLHCIAAQTTPAEAPAPLNSKPLQQEKRRSENNVQGGQRGGEGQLRGGQGKGGGSKLGNYTEPPPANRVPEHPFNIVLGRPTDSSVTIRVLFHEKAEVYVEYGLESGKLDRTTSSVWMEAKEPQDFRLERLQSNHRYFYRLVSKRAGAKRERSDEYHFQTQRAAGSSFVFSVTSDSHLDENTSGEVYLRTLANALRDDTDFHLELGDTFMTGKYVQPEFSEPQYLAQRFYLGSLCHSASLFIALGNHDGESGSRGSTAWATHMRKRLFPNPEPDGFYTGNDQKEPNVGLPQNYFQWTWGDAQFIVLDPFRYTTARGRENNNWSWTLGSHQYQWLKRSLEEVDAKYRFVFLHHLVGGSTTNNRGGVEVASLWEWGGKGGDGVDAFSKQRPGWEMPIHDLLVKHGVSIVFHGHDHLFIKQDLDGIVYQLVPQPGHPRFGNTNSAKEYGYLNGETQSSSGYIRVRVGPESTRADYVRTYLDAQETLTRRNGDVSYSYTVPSRVHPSSK